MPVKKPSPKVKRDKRGPVQAAGGIVVRPGGEPQIAVVQMRKFGHWVLPKGKLNTGEDALAAARREVLEETGHQVSVHEYLGALSYEVRRGPKVVQFWRMQTVNGTPVRKLMRDIKAVRWLSLDEAVEALTHPREQAFLAQVGPDVVQASARVTRKPKPGDDAAATEAAAPAAATAPTPTSTIPSPAALAPLQRQEARQQELRELQKPQEQRPDERPQENAKADIAPRRKTILDKLRAWVHVKTE